MNAGDKSGCRCTTRRGGFNVVVNDLTLQRTGSMTASVANGFGSVRSSDPNAHHLHGRPARLTTRCTARRRPTRAFEAAHTYNVRLLRRDRALRVLREGEERRAQQLRQAARRGYERRRQQGPGPRRATTCSACQGGVDYVSRSADVSNTDGDFDGGELQLHLAGLDQQPDRGPAAQRGRRSMFTSPLANGKNFDTMAFESDISPQRVGRHGVRCVPLLPAAHHEPGGPAPGGGLCEPAAGLASTPSTTTIRRADRACGSRAGRTSRGPPTSSAEAPSPSTARCG